MNITQVVATSENKANGKDNDRPWRIPGEQKRFKSLTTGKAVVMGRKKLSSLLENLFRIVAILS